jgi:hypothetical protein
MVTDMLGKQKNIDVPPNFPIRLAYTATLLGQY